MHIPSMRGLLPRRSNFRLLFALFWFCYQTILTTGKNYTTVTLNAIGNIGHFGLELVLENATIPNIVVDTTQSQLGIVRCQDPGNSTTCEVIEVLFVKANLEGIPVPSIFLSLDSDEVNANFSCDASCTQSSCSTCPQISYPMEFTPEAPAQVSLLLSEKFNVEDDVLHPFESSHGIIGMGYDGPSTNNSAFDRLLKASSPSGRAIFGLDLNNASSGATSQMHLGGVSDEYASILVWGQPQARDVVDQHKVFLHDLSVCGVSIFGNWSNNWEATVDTSSSCLRLPREFINTLRAYVPLNDTDDRGVSILDSDGEEIYVVPDDVMSVNSLPVIQFRLDESSMQLYVALRDLLLPRSVLQPDFQHTGVPICIKSADRIMESGTFASPPPHITLGVTVLQSLYFAADKDYVRVGFANKHSKEEIDDLLAAGYCKPRSQCYGRQNFDLYSNSCLNPSCDTYFFMEIDNEQKICVFKRSAVEGGLTIIIILAICEVVVYLVTQYSLSERASVEIDPVTTYLGKVLSVAVDTVVVSLRPELGMRERTMLREGERANDLH